MFRYLRVNVLGVRGEKRTAKVSAGTGAEIEEPAICGDFRPTNSQPQEPNHEP